jgi:hypothetical protein
MMMSLSRHRKAKMRDASPLDTLSLTENPVHRLLTRRFLKPEEEPINRTSRKKCRLGRCTSRTIGQSGSTASRRWLCTPQLHRILQQGQSHHSPLCISSAVDSPAPL